MKAPRPTVPDSPGALVWVSPDVHAVRFHRAGHCVSERPERLTAAPFAEVELAVAKGRGLLPCLWCWKHGA